jgi:anti-sigma factor RsiW
MKKISQQIEEKLLDYIDGQLSPEESLNVEEIIHSDELVKKRFDELIEADRIFHSTSLHQPSLQFTQKVLERLNEQPEKSGVSIKKSIYLLAGIIVTIAVPTLLVAAGVFDGTTNLDLNNMVIQNEYIKQPLPSIQFDGKMVVNIIIVLNIIIAFIVLDRTILKPWFEQRGRVHS